MMGFIKFIFGLLFFLALLAIIGRIFLFETATTYSYSMVPNLVGGDTFIVQTVGLIGSGDIAVCENPENSSSLVVLRVIGVPGDKLQIKKNHLIINGETIQHQHNDPLIYADSTSGEDLEYTVRIATEYVGGHYFDVALMDRAGGKNFKKVTVPDGQFFMLGDNRNMARDSRNFGFVPIESCVGKAVFLLWTKGDSGDLLRSYRVLSWI